MTPICSAARAYSSPRTRRYFLGSLCGASDSALFSAHAEVFPTGGAGTTYKYPLLRARGGISYAGNSRKPVATSSPRTRRYFQVQSDGATVDRLFSAHAEVFPYVARHDGARRRSSPRTRRYFPYSRPCPASKGLFSAHAEVFPRKPVKMGYARVLSGSENCSFARCLPLAALSTPRILLLVVGMAGNITTTAIAKVFLFSTVTGGRARNPTNVWRPNGWQQTRATVPQQRSNGSRSGCAVTECCRPIQSSFQVLGLFVHH